MPKNTDLEPGEIHEFYLRYVDLNPTDVDLIENLKQNKLEIINFFESLPEDKWDFRYAEGKWSILEVLQHIIDTERIFQYRALSLARNEANSLPGYDHESYASVSEAEKRTPKSLISEFKIVRESGLFLYESFSEEMLKRKGLMNGNTATAQAIGFVFPGHAIHHKNILSERYL